MAQRDEEGRELYVECIGKVARGKSIQIILRELADHARELSNSLVGAGAFVPFVESTRCLQLLEAVQKEKIADKVITAAPGTWLEMLQQAAENLPFALIAADMFEPGAKLVCVNAAFERLTGYERHDVLGRNCRFLQGDETEQDALQQLVDAIREAQPVQVELTNYRKDGSLFRNLLSLRPVHDSNGRYRYNIGILADADAINTSSREQFTRVSCMLPAFFETPLQRPQYDDEPSPAGGGVGARSSANPDGGNGVRSSGNESGDADGDMADQAAEAPATEVLAATMWQAPSGTVDRPSGSMDRPVIKRSTTSIELRRFNLDAQKLMWLQNLDRSLRALLQYEEELQKFSEYVQEKHSNHLRDYELLWAVMECSRCAFSAQLNVA
jgi:PAS domain S-box-containing protein